ncbi:MAG TPA: hypothetical protein PKO06_09735, partial [Candidatus Ozemobacteraceae bacterium]|nr:hypothetical protein [Candidatus Ozemobacteraceae bacterium]
LSERELKSKVEIKAETYNKTKEIEIKTAINLARTQFLPTLSRQVTQSANAVAALKAAGVESKAMLEDLKRFEKRYQEIREGVDRLEKTLHKAETHHETLDRARFLSDEGEKSLLHLRAVVDAAEEYVAADLWPMAKYQELLTIL